MDKKPVSSDMGEDFWASVNYCGYIRNMYEPGTMRQTGIFVNNAFATLAGLPDPAAVIAMFDSRNIPFPLP